MWIVAVVTSFLAMAAVTSEDSFEAKRAAALGRPRTVIWNTDGNDMVCYPRNLPCTPEVFETLRLKYARGTKINTVSYCPHASGFGWFTTRKTHDFMASDVISDDGKIHNAAGDFAKIGTDALEMAASFCRREGLEIFVSIRMNDTHDNKGSGEPPDPGLFSSFKRRHPECLMGSITNSPRFCAWTAVDFARPAVREHVRRFVREFLENYDLDGIEYDFFRHLQLLKTVANGTDATSAELDMMTELMRQLREIADEAGRKRGKPFLVAVRVPDSMGFCCAVGIDIERWMKERLDEIFAANAGAQLCVTTSRRTPADVEAVVDSYPWAYKLIYSRDRFNPIPAFVRLARRLYVTAESTGMLSEACTFGSAEVVALDNLNPGPHKFRRFVENLRRDGYVDGNRKVDLSAEFSRARELMGL